MKTVTIRDLSDEVHRAICHRAAEHDRSAEEEIRAIITETVLPPGRVKLGTLLAEIWAADPLTDEEHALFNNRDRTATEPISFDE
ncbi:FitA-like ribbon-helix-helix domain-containing protein [Nocardia sp. NPDC003963]